MNRWRDSFGTSWCRMRTAGRTVVRCNQEVRLGINGFGRGRARRVRVAHASSGRVLRLVWGQRSEDDRRCGILPQPDTVCSGRFEGT